MGSVLESVGVLLSIGTPLVAVPLTVITFYLRSLREHQVSRHADVLNRLEMIESALSEVRGRIRDFERDYTTKEEWLRECMASRRTLERMHEAMIRLEASWRAQGPSHVAQSEVSLSKEEED